MRNWFDFFTHVKQQNFNPCTIVDVGVATDTEELYMHFPQAKYLFVEPCVEFEPSLQNLCQQYPGSNYMLAAAGATDGEITINVSPNLGGTSVFRTRESLDGAWEEKPRTVPMFRIDTMWNALNLTGPALLKIDVQGAEIEVLKGAADVLTNFEIIILEVGMIEQYVGQPIFHEYVSYMADQDYVVYDIIHTGYADTGVLAQIDLVFVKKHSEFRKDQRCLVDYSQVKIRPGYQEFKGIRRNENI
jgi:FkbM family methyltransferase